MSTLIKKTNAAIIAQIFMPTIKKDEVAINEPKIATPIKLPSWRSILKKSDKHNF